MALLENGLSGVFIAEVRDLRDVSKKEIKSDKNENFPVFLDVLAGTAPSKRSVNGTLAVNGGFSKAGGFHVFAFAESTPHPEYGRQFLFKSTADVTDDRKLRTSLVVQFGAFNIVQTHEVEEDSEPETTPTHIFETQPSGEE